MKRLIKKFSLIKVPYQIIILLMVLFAVNIVVNGGIDLRALVKDDLRFWMYYDNREGALDFIFGAQDAKFRPVFFMLLYSLYKIFGNHIYLFDGFNLLLNFGVVAVLFLIFRKLSGNVWVSFCLGCIYLVSRFAYYVISQVFGIEEALALLGSVAIAYLMWRFVRTGQRQNYWLSIVLFTLVIFVHERYVTLLFFFMAVLISLGINRKNLVLFGIATLPVLLNFGIKKVMLGVNPLYGTGGLEITDTFNLSQVISFLISGVHYIIGVNAGPIHLNGIPFDQVPWYLNVFILLGIGCITLFGFLFLKHSLRQENQSNTGHTRTIILFLAFIFATLLGSCVTIRLEMRWVYTPFCGFLLLIAYLAGVLLTDPRLRKQALILITLWTLIVIPAELIYRTYYPNLYFWKTQTAGNQLYENTVGRYGNGFWDYDTYLICPDMKCPDLNYGEGDELRLFFSQFSQGMTVDHQITVVPDVSQIDPQLLYAENVIILRFDPQTYGVTEITHQ